MNNFEHTTKGRAVLAQTEADNEGMFQAARNDRQVLKEFLTQIDFSDELSVLMQSTAPEYYEGWFRTSEEILVNDGTLADAITCLIATDERYARRFYDMLVEEYKGFYK